MKQLQLFKSFAFLLMLLLFVQSCSDSDAIGPKTDFEPPLTNRSITPDSLFELHNDFIWWLFDNHSDSAFYYADDDVTDFLDFVYRMRLDYDSADFDLVTELIDDDTLIFSSPYYVKNSGFTNQLPDWTTAEFDSINVVIDSAMVSFENGDSEATVLDIIERGKDRIDAIPASTFKNKDALLNTLTQATFSTELLYDLEEEFGNGLVILPCYWYSSAADYQAYSHFEDLGDFEQGSTMASHAMAWVIGVSSYTLAKCFGQI